jgi:hypothetical protein
MFNRIVLLCILSVGLCQAQTTYYVSDISGDDNNVGSEAAPFKTIQKAANVMQAGETCLIKQGVYRETVTPPTSGLTFKNYQDDYVVVTGLDLVENWTNHSGNIFKASVLDSVTQVFVGGKRMNWARHPNQDGNMLSKRDMMDVDFDIQEPTGKSKKAILNEVGSKPLNFWKGGFLLGVSGANAWWTSLRGRIVSSSGNEVQCEDISFKWEKITGSFGGVGKAFIIGAFNAMDSGTEWIWQDEELFYYIQNGEQINNLIVEARTRVTAFDLSDKSNIKLEGLHIKAANIIMPSATNCTITNCTLKYSGTFSNYYLDSFTQREAWGDYENSGAAISVGGNNNTIKDSYIGHTWTTGVSLYGNFNTLQNCIVEEADWMGERMSLVSNLGDDNQILNNTLRRAGRDGIEMGHHENGIRYARRATVKNNLVNDVAYFSPDSGYLYVNHTRGWNELANSEIAYNIMDGYHSPTYFSGHGGIYLDNGSSGYTIHHNVIMNSETGIHINDIKRIHRPNNVFTYNNTGINVKKVVNLNQVPHPDRDPTHTQVVAINNIGNHENTKFTATEERNNSKVSSSEFVDLDNNDFQLKSGSSAIDAGEEIVGITDGHMGVAPDLGAFEFGVAPWEAGADISMPILVDELGFIKELINGDPIDQDDIDDAVAEAEAEEAKQEATAWKTTNEAKWYVTDYTALNQATKNSLDGEGGIAYRQIFDLTPGQAYTMTFDYNISNKDGASGAGVRVSIHEGAFSESNYSNLASKQITTSAQVDNPEIGSESISFTPNTDTIYAIFHKIGAGSQKSKVQVGRLEFQTGTLSNSDFDIEGVRIYTVNRAIIVKGADLEKVYNIIGQEVKNRNLKSGVYIVKVSKGSAMVTKKVLVK